MSVEENAKALHQLLVKVEAFCEQLQKGKERLTAKLSGEQEE